MRSSLQDEKIALILMVCMVYTNIFAPLPKSITNKPAYYTWKTTLVLSISYQYSILYIQEFLSPPWTVSITLVRNLPLLLKTSF